ncbi:hypothetical protein CJF42_06145 [Pseudoalteromonas sp. NBT06-2]|uniref:hypothetical protein n=1 Tax=Pseudoalteromonas sp. NBT06-2 TaxID=2025950 RepID=UPI000BA5CF8C|nr:hypothetical protein [Pseudoalteromonas sp. NBT06-2]PAJ75227.1 hypothetical protein CJF42_06145 [Pseudoalteromonas sp. NBT06-2]
MKELVMVKIALALLFVGLLVMMNGSMDLAFSQGFSVSNANYIPPEFFKGVATISMGLIIAVTGITVYIFSRLFRTSSK